MVYCNLELVFLDRKPCLHLELASRTRIENSMIGTNECEFVLVCMWSGQLVFKIANSCSNDHLRWRTHEYMCSVQRGSFAPEISLGTIQECKDALRFQSDRHSAI